MLSVCYLEQLLEARVAAEWDKRRIDPQQSRRQIGRNLEERLDMVERLLVLTGEQVDPGQAFLNARPPHRVLRHGSECRGLFAFRERLSFASQVGKGEGVADSQSPWRRQTDRSQLGFIFGTRQVGIVVHPGDISPKRVDLGPAQGPGGSVVAVPVRPEGEREALLCVIEQPGRILGCQHRKSGRLDLLGGRAKHRACPRKIPLVE